MRSHLGEPAHLTGLTHLHMNSPYGWRDVFQPCRTSDNCINNDKTHIVFQLFILLPSKFFLLYIIHTNVLQMIFCLLSFLCLSWSSPYLNHSLNLPGLHFQYNMLNLLRALNLWNLRSKFLTCWWWLLMSALFSFDAMEFLVNLILFYAKDDLVSELYPSYFRT